MPNAAELETLVDDILGTTFNERESNSVPKSEDVTLKNAAVKVEATFLYADLAGSAQLSEVCPWETTAKVIRAFLDCSTRIIRARGGEIRSFDGDRVMGVFMGDLKNTQATNCAREIYHSVYKIINPKARAKFNSIKNNDINIRHAVGIATGTVRAVRAGIRNNNDLVWIGKPASLAAKLSDNREFPYCSFISKKVYDALPVSSKVNNGQEIWEARTFKFAGKTESVYRSKWLKNP